MKLPNNNPGLWNADDDKQMPESLVSASIAPSGQHLPSFPGETAFESGFIDSPFGPNWDLDNRYRRVPPGILNKEESDYTGPGFDITKLRWVLVMHTEPDAIQYWLKNLDTGPDRVAVFFQMKKNFVYKDYAGTKRLLREYGFKPEAVDKLIGVTMGYAIIKEDLSDSDISKITQELLQWFFPGNADAQKAYRDILYQLLLREYQLYHPDELKWWQKLLLFLAKVLGPILELVRKFIVWLLKKLSGLVERLKIENRKFWDPGSVDEKGGNNYLPFFFPVMAFIKPTEILQKIKEQFDKIDAKILSFLGESHKEIRGGHENIENNRGGIISTIRFFYDQISTALRIFYDAIYSFFAAVEKFINYVNAFLVGVYNGLIGFVSETISGVMMLFEDGGFSKFVAGIKELINEIKNKGFFGFLMDTIKEIFHHFKEKYENEANSYDVLKMLGEDLVSIILMVITAVQTGAVLFRNIKAFLKRILDAVKDPKKGIEDIKALFRKEAKEEKIIKQEEPATPVEDDGLIKMYRIQGGKPPNASRHRFVFGKNKRLFIEGDERLYVTFKDENRVLEFWIKRGESAEVFTADVRKSFYDKLMRDVVPQRRGKEFPDRPQYADFSKTKNSIGIPKNYFEDLLRNMSNIERLKLD